MPKASSPSREEKGPKRPPNAWILFRSDMNRQLRIQNPKMTQSALSKHISELWQNALPEIRADYERRAEAAKVAHQIQYPDYKFAPRKKEEIAREKQAKLLAKEERARKNARNNLRPPVEELKSRALYPTIADFGPLGPSPPGSAAGSPADFNHSRESSPPQLLDSGPSHTFSSPAAPQLSLPGPSTWSGPSAQVDAQFDAEAGPETWQNSDLHSMLSYDIPMGPNSTQPPMNLSSWDDSLGVVLMGTGDSSIFQLNPFDNAIIDGQQNLDLNISMGEMDNLFGTTPWDFNQTMSQNDFQSQENVDFGAIINSLSDYVPPQNSSYEINLGGESQNSSFGFAPGPSEPQSPSFDTDGLPSGSVDAYINLDPAPATVPPQAVSSSSQTYEQTAAQQTNTVSYVPPTGAAYASNRRVGGTWSQYGVHSELSAATQ